jgi:hypothetical protein
VLDLGSPADVSPRRDALEAHRSLAIVFAALARHLQNTTGLSVRRLVQTLRPLRDVTIRIAGQTVTARPGIPTEVQAILEQTTHKAVQLRSRGLHRSWVRQALRSTTLP